MTTSTYRFPNDTGAPVPPPGEAILAAASPADLSRHRDYDGRGMAIEPLDHLDGDEDCRRFTVR